MTTFKVLMAVLFIILAVTTSRLFKQGFVKKAPSSCNFKCKSSFTPVIGISESGECRRFYSKCYLRQAQCKHPEEGWLVDKEQICDPNTAPARKSKRTDLKKPTVGAPWD